MSQIVDPISQQYHRAIRKRRLKFWIMIHLILLLILGILLLVINLSESQILPR